MAFVKSLRCRECAREYPIEPMNVCDFCFGPLEVVYDYDAICASITKDKIMAGPHSMWRYQDLLPVEGQDIVDINPGFTPLLRAWNLGKLLGLDELYLKNDCVNPSYSFKDRVVSVAINKALEFGFDTIACASTGNLGGSVAAHSARAGVKSYVFFPADLEQGKILGASIYGPTLVAVHGSYDEVNRLCSEIADNYHWAFVNINIRPFYAEGSKTLAYEVAEQLGWQSPAHCVVPGASGSLFTKIWKGFHEFHDVGLIGDVNTRMHIAQPEGCCPIVTAYEEETTAIKPVRPNTIAKSLAIGNPADGYFALKTIQESNGSACMAMENEVVMGMKLLAQTEGIFAETAGGVTIACLKRLVERGLIKKDEPTVAYITGNGLKTQEAVQDVVDPIFVKPTLGDFEEAMKSIDSRSPGQ